MSEYYAYQVLPIAGSDMLAWVVYDDQHRVVGSGADVTESDAHVAIHLCVETLQPGAPLRAVEG
ncbi:hypothetical protein [Caulobacter sp. S45]|jgi:hypothetical protein|uniref:hypothetical protein n=1 Tax=Caulobacter sp. S45 TaxID=1641861 RepID=UPI00131AB2B0|nr:hypothetical protein [Caulobacter sp. S45]